MKLGAILGRQQAALYDVARQNEKAIKDEQRKKREREIAKQRRRDGIKRYKRD